MPLRLRASARRGVSGLDRLIYIDESYEKQHSRYAVYAWLECHPVEWRRGLREWLEFRKRLRLSYGIEVDTELHATKFFNGRDAITRDHVKAASHGMVDGQGRIMQKNLGREVAAEALEMLGNATFLRVRSAWRKVPIDEDFGVALEILYADVIEMLESELREANSYAMVTVDGDAAHFRRAHRALKLDTRHIIEDPIVHDSQTSQWMQMADIVAYTTLVHLNRAPHNEYAWRWHEKFLENRHGKPIAL